VSESAAFAIWITGLPASGKSTIAARVSDQLKRRGIKVAVLESDALRREFTGPEKYEQTERDYFYTSMVLIGATLTSFGVPVIFDATANRREYRERARSRIPRFIEIYVNTPLEVCMDRDPKGIYRGGISGKFQNVPGIQAEYEPPEHPDLAVDGATVSPESAAELIVQVVEKRGFIGGKRSATT